MGIILRLNKGSELTFAEVDGNFQSLFYSASLIGTELTFYYPSSSLSQSVDLSNLPGFSGSAIYNGNTFVGDGIGTFYFTGSAIQSITTTGSNGVLIDLAGGGGGGGSGIFQQSASSDVYYTTYSLQVTGSTIQQSPFTTIGDNITASDDGTGGGVDKYAVVVSESVWHYTDNVGVPTSKAWKTDLDGSYFNNFDQNTDTAEILRFIAGLLSSSAPAASPNTKYYDALNGTRYASTEGTAPAGVVPQSITDPYVVYLNGKGFADTGDTIFSGISTIYNSSGMYWNYRSVAGGSTTISSSNDTELFGLGDQGDTFYVSGSQSWSFADNAAKTETANSSSEDLLSRTGEGTSDGLTIGYIGTIDPLIPAQYQDGKFVSTYQANLYNGGISFTNYTESVGWYTVSSSVAVASGSSNYSDFKEDHKEIFYANTTQLDSLIPTNTRAIGYFGTASLTATSRSLSGAPYLRTATYTASGSITGVFDPLFADSTTCARFTESDPLVTLGGNAYGTYVLSTNGGTIQTANVVYDSTGTTVRATSTVPYETDLIKLTGSLTFNAGTSGADNINQTGLGTTSFSFLTKARNRNSSEATLRTDSFDYHKAGTFNQTLASGSMAYYGRAQGYDGGSLTGTSEAFSGESYRLQITDNALTGSYSDGDAFVTTYVVNNLGAKDLQVKPGYLVYPEGTYGYWITDPSPSQLYKYYARGFQRNSATGATSMTINVGATLNAWESTSDGVAVALLYNSSGIDVYNPPRIYDPTQLTSNLISGSMANDNVKNPFSIPIALYGNTGGSLNGTTYTVPLRSADGMVLDGTYQDFIVIIRYKGDPTPVSSISITYS